MNISHKFTILFLVEFLVSFKLRLGLTLVDRLTSDSHKEVVSFIIKTIVWFFIINLRLDR
jgi:hypothetical protein